MQLLKEVIKTECNDLKSLNFLLRTALPTQANYKKRQLFVRTAQLQISGPFFFTFCAFTCFQTVQIKQLALRKKVECGHASSKQ